MAVTHILYNKGTQYGALLKAGLQGMEIAFDGLNNLKATMALMIDGDGSQDSHFTYLANQFGFDTPALAKAGWEELNSLLFKLNTNDSVSDVNAALLQVFNKFR